jgi:drug/metabolite transporter (DMT)-like permease
MTGMVELWVWLTLAAALLQAVRTAGQKQLNGHLSVLAGTYVRALLGLPVMVVYLGLLTAAVEEPWPAAGPAFVGYCVATALTQLAASAALLSLFRLRNFAVANQLGKSDMVFTALIGSALLGQHLTGAGWCALALTALGVATIMLAKAPLSGSQWHSLSGIAGEPSVRIGLFVGLMFGICNLTLREATLALPGGSRAMAGALTVTAVTAIQAVLMGAWLAWREPGTLGLVAANGRLAAFVGVTSALGSILWFTAFAIETAAHVRIVGQVEVVFTLAIARLYFREAITALEGLGIALTIAGIVLVQAMG